MSEALPASTPSGHLFRTYALLINALVGTLLLASAVLSLTFSYRESRSHLMALQLEQAQGAAARIEQYVADIEQQLGWTALAGMGSTGDPLELRRIDYLKLLRQVPAITEAAWLDAQGREQVHVSRLAMDAQGQAIDRSAEPVYTEPKAGRVYRSPVSFRKQTEPYMTIARRAGPGSASGVTVVEVNLKFVWDVVARIHPGGEGLAYAVDGSGALIAHPDISLVLKQTSLAGLPQVAASLQAAGAMQDRASGAARTHAVDAVEASFSVSDARDLAGQPVLSSWAQLDTLGWRVFVESPRSQALEPVYASLERLGLLLAVGLLISVLASAWLARTLVRPIRALQEGAARIGAGDLGHRIEVSSGGELQALAGEFNHMAGDLKASYTGMEHKVEARTAELAEALAHQTATAEVLQVIGSSVADAVPVFEKILDSCERLLDTPELAIYLVHGDGQLHVGAARGDNVAAMSSGLPRPVDETATGLAFRTRGTLYIPDAAAMTDMPPTVRAAIDLSGNYSVVFAPMLWEGRGIGSICVSRRPATPFAEKEIALLKTFADQAVIAIQNARLFNDTQEALAQQTAIAELVKAMSRTSFQLDALLPALIENATRLCRSDKGFVFLRDGEDYVMRVQHGSTDGPIELRPLREEMGTLVGRTALTRLPVAIADAMSDPGYTLKDAQQRLGYRSMLGVPMLRDGQPIGVISLWRDDVRAFSDQDQRLLSTFADQAVIAIENARLFEQLQAKTEQLEVAGRHKSEFLANMSHELRTPLNAIIGFSEVLVEQMFGAVNAKQMEYLRDIHSSGLHLLTLINDVLDLSKIEAGHMELELTEFDLGDLLDHTLALVRERAARNGLTLALDVPADLPLWVADARKVKQVLLNLLSNAVKFTPAGGSVTLSARHTGGDSNSNHDEAARSIEISVTDTGVGISPQDQAAVFEAFRQASGSYLRKSEGTGLGLALAQRFVELHGGTLGLRSTPGQGSTFTFTLPARTLEAA